MTERIAQHLVPEVYLKRFTDKRTKRLTVLRGTLDSADLWAPPRSVPPKKVAVRDDFYTLWDQEGVRSEFLELQLSRVEQQFPVFFKALRVPGEPTNQVISEVRSLAVVQHMRSSRQRDFLGTWANLQSAVDEMGQPVTDSFTSSHEINSLLARQPDAEQRRKGAEYWARIALPQAFEALRATFRWLYVCILRSESMEFITSDHPVSLFDPTQDKSKDWVDFPYHRLPLEVTYPLTKRACALMGYWEMPRQAIIDASIVNAINARTAALCEREIYVTPFLSGAEERRFKSEIVDAEWRKPLLWKFALPPPARISFESACREAGVEKAAQVRIPRWWWLGFEAFPSDMKEKYREMKSSPGEPT